MPVLLYIVYPLNVHTTLKRTKKKRVSKSRYLGARLWPQCSETCLKTVVLQRRYRFSRRRPKNIKIYSSKTLNNPTGNTNTYPSTYFSSDEIKYFIKCFEKPDITSHVYGKHAKALLGANYLNFKYRSTLTYDTVCSTYT